MQNHRLIVINTDLLATHFKLKLFYKSQALLKSHSDYDLTLSLWVADRPRLFVREGRMGGPSVEILE